MLLFTSCNDPQKINKKNTGVLFEKDTLISFSIELVERLDDRIEWNRIEFDSVTSEIVTIHRPIYYLSDKNDFEESVNDIDLLKYFTKDELSKSTVHPLSPVILKKYGFVNANTVRYWYKEYERFQLEDTHALIPASFQWYFSVSEPILSENGKYIYMEIFESNIDRESFWVYVLKKEKGIWKRFYVKEIKVKM